MLPILCKNCKNAAFHNILRSDSRASTVSIYEQLGMPFLEKRRFSHTASKMYKIVYNITPSHIGNTFMFVEEVSSMPTQATR